MIKKWNKDNETLEKTESGIKRIASYRSKDGKISTIKSQEPGESHHDYKDKVANVTYNEESGTWE